VGTQGAEEDIHYGTQQETKRGEEGEMKGLKRFIATIRARLYARAIAGKNRAEAELRVLYSRYPPHKCIHGTRIPLLMTMELHGDMGRWCALKKNIDFFDWMSEYLKEAK